MTEIGGYKISNYSLVAEVGGYKISNYTLVAEVGGYKISNYTLVAEVGGYKFSNYTLVAEVGGYQLFKLQIGGRSVRLTITAQSEWTSRQYMYSVKKTIHTKDMIK